jgi:hypothetical protein
MSWLGRRVEVNSSSVTPGKLETSLRRKLLNCVCVGGILIPEVPTFFDMLYTFERTIRVQGDRSLGGILRANMN